MNRRITDSGFSLAETVIAVAIVASTGLVLIALLGQITDQTGDIAQGAAIRREAATIRHFMRTRDFEEIYQKVQTGESLELVIYDYLGVTDRFREDGSLEPSSGSRGTLVSTARWLDDPLLSADLAAAPDFVFRAKLGHFGEELPENPGEYLSASLPFELRLWEVPGNAFELPPAGKPDQIFFVHIFR